jgi:adenosylhomocysteine nucleosidase
MTGVNAAGTHGTTLVCFAVKEEAVHFRPWATSRPEIRVLVTGMGRKNTAAALQNSLAQHTPGLVLTCGFAGGVDPRLKTGDLVFETEGPSSLREALKKSGAREGRFACVETVAVTAAEKKQLRSQTEADAVEMESAVIREICRGKGIPSATLRVILVAAEEDLPLAFSKLMTPDMKIDPVKLGLAVAKSPGRIPALIRFAKQTQSAARALARALEQVLVSTR